MEDDKEWKYGRKQGLMKETNGKNNELSWWRHPKENHMYMRNVIILERMVV